MTTTEEFTFPISPAPFLDSPPLWRRAGPTSTSERTETLTHAHQRKSFSCLEGDHRRWMESEGHDRMDLLWEDFNDELPKKRNSFVCNSARSSDDDDDDDLPEFGCVPMAIKGGAGGGRVAMAKNKKISVVVLGKVIKRLFLLQRQSVKRRSW